MIESSCTVCNNKYEKRKSAFDLVDDCICLQGRCIDHKTYEMITSIETVDNLALSTCLSLACLFLEFVNTYSMPLRIKSTERQKSYLQMMKVYMLHK